MREDKRESKKRDKVSKEIRFYWIELRIISVRVRYCGHYIVNDNIFPVSSN